MNVVISHLSNKVNNQLLALELGGGKPPPGSLALLCAAKLHEGIPGRIRINQRQYSTNAYMDIGHSSKSKLKTLFNGESDLYLISLVDLTAFLGVLTNLMSECRAWISSAEDKKTQNQVQKGSLKFYIYALIIHRNAMIA